MPPAFRARRRAARALPYGAYEKKRFAVGGYAFGAGTYASIVSINRASAESGGPFACDCMARQCVK